MFIKDNLFIIIVDVQQFICYCLIPLYPCLDSWIYSEIGLLGMNQEYKERTIDNKSSPIYKLYNFASGKYCVCGLGGMM